MFDGMHDENVYFQWVVLCASLQCFDTVGWATGRASGL